MKKVKWKKSYSIILSVVGLLILVRALLPVVVLRYANGVLSDLDGYQGRVENIDIALYRGAYQLDNLYLNEVDSATGAQTEFFRVDRVDLSIEWGAEEANRFEIVSGRIQYMDSTSSPVVNIALQETRVLAENLTNKVNDESKLPANLIARAQAYGGTLRLEVALDPLNEYPTFDLTAEIEGANLPDLNDFFKAYGKFDISRGTFGLYTEFAADGGRYKGYVKPIIKDLEVVGLEDRQDSFFQRIKEAVVDFVGTILENPTEEQVATRVPIEGSFADTQVLVWEAVWEILRNAFVQALIPQVDHAIDIRSPADVDNRTGIFGKDPS